jgi:hypothetical protein
VSARVVHIGPHNTGSTALQSLMHGSREELLAQGVRYAGSSRHEAAAVRWVTDRMVAGQDRAHGANRWRQLVEELRTSEGRAVMSSEFFSDATDEQIERIIGELGTDTRIVITLRPLAKILPSQYQQYLQRGSVVRYGRWLNGIFNEPPYDRPTPSFWVRHRHDVLARRWARLVGADNVTAVVLDPRDFDFLPRAFEELLALKPGTLTGKEARENRSLTFAESELLRRFNNRFHAAELGKDLYAQLLRRLRDDLKERKPRPHEEKILTPDWAVERANQVAAEMAQELERSGVQVIGDLSLLSAVPLTGQQDVQPPLKKIDTPVAVHFAAALAAACDDVADARVRAALRRAAAG